MRRGGFTLVELLVVISVIALVAALSFPVFHNSREQARATACGANVRQLAIAMQAYEAANQSFPYGFARPGEIRPPGGYAGNPSIDPPGWWWFNYIGATRYRTFRDMNTLRCPSRRIEGTRLKLDVLCGNYGVNRALCRSVISPEPGNEFEGTPLSLEAVRHPGATMLLMDSGYTLICWWNAAKDPPVTFGSSIQDAAYVPGLLEVNGQKLLWSGQSRDAKEGRHPNQTLNVAFVDGQVRRMNARVLLVETTDDGDWNCKPLWSPD